MKNVLITTAVALAACVSVAAVPQAPQASGLSDLSAMTFGCPTAALNAAARQAAKTPSQGSYQFSYFKLINDAHHAAYEVHFKSNYQGEAELRFCVEMYCQQGFDPKTTKTSITLMSTQRAGVTTHGAACGVHTPPPVSRQLKK